MIKYRPTVLTFLASALTLNPTIAVIVLFLSALAHGFTPQVFVLVKGILKAVTGFIEKELSDVVMINFKPSLE